MNPNIRHKLVQKNISSPEVEEAEMLAEKIMTERMKLLKIPFHVFRPAKSFASTKGDINKHADGGDLILLRFDDYMADIRTVEVKRLSKNNILSTFTDANSFVDLLGKDEFIIDGKNQLDKKKRIYLYMTFNYPLTHYVIVKPHELENIFIKETNGNYGTKEYYVTKASNLEFCEVNNG